MEAAWGSLIKMAVIISKIVMMDKKEVKIRSFEPSGSLSKEDREGAEHLDQVLKEQVPVIANKVLKETKGIAGTVKRWFLLGKKLRPIVHDTKLVLRTDLDSGMIWDAIWQYLPQEIRPKRIDEKKPYSEMRRRRKDILTLCYEISEFEWSEVEWIKRWDDWNQIAFRPGMIRDKRIFESLRKAITELDDYPKTKEFREILKSLRDAFPTRKLRDSSQFSDDRIKQIVKEAVESAFLT